MAANIDVDGEVFCHCGKRNYESAYICMFILFSLTNIGVHFEAICACSLGIYSQAKGLTDRESSIVIFIFACLQRRMRF